MPGAIAVVDPSAGRADLVDATRRALAAQTTPVLGVATGPVPERIDAEWLWLLDGVTVPEPEALAAFGAALQALAGTPEPLLLAGRVLGEDGRLHPDAAPRHEIFEKELTVAAIERGLVQVRAVPSGSLLVRRSTWERFGPLRTDLPPSWAAFDFTARALRAKADPGYLVPASRAVRRLPPRPPGRRGGGLRTRARLLTGPTWTATERLWEGFLVGEGTLRAVRGPARRA